MEKVTAEELNKFLVDNDVRMALGRNVQAHSTYFDIEEGWYPLVLKLMQDLVAIGWNKQIAQVKEKFGGLRFYIMEGNDPIWELIEKAENASFDICESCGATDKVGTESIYGWYKTYCSTCYSEEKAAIDTVRSRNG